MNGTYNVKLPVYLGFLPYEVPQRCSVKGRDSGRLHENQISVDGPLFKGLKAFPPSLC